MAVYFVSVGLPMSNSFLLSARELGEGSTNTEFSVYRIMQSTRPIDMAASREL